LYHYRANWNIFKEKRMSYIDPSYNNVTAQQQLAYVRSTAPQGQDQSTMSKTTGQSEANPIISAQAPAATQQMLEVINAIVQAICQIITAISGITGGSQGAAQGSNPSASTGSAGASGAGPTTEASNASNSATSAEVTPAKSGANIDSTEWAEKLTEVGDSCGKIFKYVKKTWKAVKNSWSSWMEGAGSFFSKIGKWFS
jgi:hypothetical protein